MMGAAVVADGKYLRWQTLERIKRVRGGKREFLTLYAIGRLREKRRGICV